MLHSLLKTNSAISFLIVGGFGIILWAALFFMDFTFPSDSMPIVPGLLNELTVQNPKIYALSVALVSLITALVLQSSLNRAQIGSSMSIEPTFWAIGFSSVYLLIDNPLPFALANLFLALGFRRLAQMKTSGNEISVAFDCGIFMSLATICSTAYFVFIIAVWISMANIKALVWRELLWTILGFIFPFTIVFSIAYLFSYDVSVLLVGSFELSGLEHMAWPVYVFHGLTICILVWAILNAIVGMGKENISKRKLIWASLGYLLTAFFIVILYYISGEISGITGVLFIPFVLFSSYVLSNERRQLFVNIMSILWVISVIVMAYSTI